MRNMYSIFDYLKLIFLRYKEGLLYLFFGGLSVIVNIGLFFLFNRAINWGEHVANILSWIITVLFVYITNKLWVFNSDITTKKETVKQITFFFAGRIGVLLFEEIALFIFITKMKFDSIIVKSLVAVMTIILNYIISKFIVFRGKIK